jgi:hypothetical protein
MDSLVGMAVAGFIILSDVPAIQNGLIVRNTGQTHHIIFLQMEGITLREMAHMVLHPSLVRRY